MDTTTDNAKEQALAQAESIKAMVAALNVDYERLAELRDERDSLQWDVDNADEGDTAPHQALVAWAAENGAELAELEADAGDCEDNDAARETILEDPLSVEVRSGWHAPGGDATAAEFSILLCTGGPAVRIVGDLDEYLQPVSARIECQDWFTPWVQADDGISEKTLLQYCNCFYFGE